VDVTSISPTTTRSLPEAMCIEYSELMEWYGKRAHMRQSGLTWGMVEEANIDLLKDKPYMSASTPRPPVEDTENPFRPQRPGRHGTGATTHARSSRTATPQYNQNPSRDTTYRRAPSRSQTLIHPRAEKVSKLYREIVKRRRVRMGRERRTCQRRQRAGATQRPHGDRRQR
jgi:hypothetical protein